MGMASRTEYGKSWRYQVVSVVEQGTGSLIFGLFWRSSCLSQYTKTFYKVENPREAITYEFKQSRLTSNFHQATIHTARFLGGSRETDALQLRLWDYNSDCFQNLMKPFNSWEKSKKWSTDKIYYLLSISKWNISLKNMHLIQPYFIKFQY